jgi:hypothetical protein
LGAFGGEKGRPGEGFWFFKKSQNLKNQKKIAKPLGA